MAKVPLIFLIFIITGCAYYLPTKQKKEQFRSALPEVVYAGEVVVQPKEPPEETSTAVPETISFSQSQENLSQGWRVQIATANEQYEAKKIKDEAERKLGVKVYIQYNAPVYKIRAGDFPDRDSAMEFCEKAKRLGYPDAYPIPSEIIIKK